MVDSKQVIELLAGAMGISCRGKDGCRVVCILKWEDVQAISTVIQQQDEQLSDAVEEIKRLKDENTAMTLRLAIYAMRNLTSKQIDEVCQRIVKGQGGGVDGSNYIKA